MKVLYILSTTTLSNGATKAFLTLCFGLRKKGVEPIVICPNKGGGYQLLKNKGVKTFCIANRNSVFPPFNSIKNKCLYIPRLVIHSVINTISVFKLKKICTDLKPDIIHSNGALIDVGYRTARKLKIPHIYHLREYQDLDFGMKIKPSMNGFKDILSKSFSICITTGVKQHFITDQNKDKMRVIYDGVHDIDNIAFCPKKEKYFLFVGRIDEAKGFKNVIIAFSRFIKKHNGYKLLVAGAPLSLEYFEEIKSYIQKNGLNNYVVFLGIRDDVDNLMQRAYAFIMSSRFEGFGLVTAEAMFNGCLVIGHNTGGTKEQFDNGLQMIGDEIGLRYNNVDELYERMIDVAENGIESYFPMIMRSQKAASSLYSIETYVDKVLEYYKTILNN